MGPHELLGFLPKHDSRTFSTEDRVLMEPEQQKIQNIEFSLLLLPSVNFKADFLKTDQGATYK